MTSLTLFLFEPQVFLEERGLTLFITTQEEIRQTDEKIYNPVPIDL